MIKNGEALGIANGYSFGQSGLERGPSSLCCFYSTVVISWNTFIRFNFFVSFL